MVPVLKGLPDQTVVDLAAKGTKGTRASKAFRLEGLKEIRASLGLKEIRVSRACREVREAKEA